MTKRKIFFRADADAQIGYGHFTRTLALADMLREYFDCTFFTQSPSEYQQREAEKICSLVALPSDNSKFEKFLNYLTGEEIVVLDNYFYTTEYQKRIKGKGCKLVCIDDMHDKHYVADVVVNHGLTDESLFDVEPYTRLCLGFDYALLRKPFLQKVDEKKREKGHWFICFGGTDWNNLTYKYVSFLTISGLANKISIVIGDQYKHQEMLKSLSGVTIHRNLSADEMSDLLLMSEYAILPCSSICIEALSRGCKVCAGYYVDNQEDFYRNLAIQYLIYPLGNMLKIKDVRHSFSNLFISSFPTCVNMENIKWNYLKLFNSLYNEDNQF